MNIMSFELAQLLQHYLPMIEQRTSRQQKDRRSRIQFFVDWLAAIDGEFNQQRIQYYRDYLQTERGLKPSSIRVYLGSVKAWLRDVCSQEQFRLDLFMLMQEDAAFPDDSFAQHQAIYHLIDRIANSIPADMVRRKANLEPTDGFCPDLEHIQALIDRIDATTLQGVRDLAVIANMAILGLRQVEVCALDVDNLLLPLNISATVGLRIPDKPSCVPRDIPLVGFEVVHQLSRHWVKAADIASGPLFRGFYRGYTSVRPERLSPRSVEEILRSYPVLVDGMRTVLKPLELRRFAARLLAQRGLGLEALCAFLGVAQVQTLVGYLGGKLPPSHAELNFDRLNQALLRKLP